MNRKRRRSNRKPRAGRAKNAAGPGALAARGNALAAAGRFADAAAAFRRAVARDPGNFAAWCNLGSALAHTGAGDDARKAYAEALELQPRSVDALSNLAIFEAESGDHATARRLFRRILDLDPGEAETWHDYSLIKTFQPGDSDLAAIERLRARPGLAAAKAMFLDFAAAKAYQDLGDYDAAFRRFASANRLKRASLDYDVAADEALAGRIAAAFGADLFAANAGAGSADERPVFIVGMPRSGTSLVEQILASHSRVHALGEVDHFRDVVVGRAGAGPGLGGRAGTGRGFPEAVADLAGRDFRSLGADYVKLAAADAGKAARVTDKMPRNFFFVGLIHLALPRARIVHCVRDPIDTCLSCFQIHFPAGQDFTYDLADLGRYYRLYARLMDHWRTVLPDRVLDVRYEDLVADPEPQMRALLDHCGLEWEDACRDFHRNRRAVHTASAHQVHRPIYRSSVARWRRYEKHLGPLLDALGPLAAGD